MIVLTAEIAVAVLIIINDEQVRHSPHVYILSHVALCTAMSITIYLCILQLGEEIENHMVSSVQNPKVMEDKYSGNMTALTASWNVMQVNVSIHVSTLTTTCI